MSNKTDDKSLEQDEAFIDALYDDLSQAPSPDSSLEEPSVELDNKILAAAHKAVGAKPKLVVKAKAKKPAFTWFKPIASAASLILVVSLVLKQGEPPVINEMTSQPGIDATVKKESQQAAEQFVMEQQAAPQAVVRRPESAGQISQQMVARQRALAPQASLTPAAKEKKTLARVKIDGSQDLLTAELAAVSDRQVAAPLEKDKRQISVKIRALEEQEYLAYRKQNLAWSWVEESSDAYVIDVMLKDEVRRFLLAKKKFRLPIEKENKTGLLRFELIQYLDKP